MEAYIEELPTIAVVTCFCGRHFEVERVITAILSQTYKGKIYHLLYNNSPFLQSLGNLPIKDNYTPILINNNKDRVTKGDYKNTGSIFRDAISYLPLDTQVVTFGDSDDIFLPTHLQEGINGIKRAQGLGCLAYKPYYSYFLYENKCELMHNTLEPSIFVNFKYLKETGFNLSAVTYHQKWIDLLIDRKQLFTDPSGIPTLMYNWSQNHGNYKISGGGDSEANFYSHRRWEDNRGDGVLNPAPLKDLEYFYIMAKHTKKQ